MANDRRLEQFLELAEASAEDARMWVALPGGIIMGDVIREQDYWQHLDEELSQDIYGEASMANDVIPREYLHLVHAEVLVGSIAASAPLQGRLILHMARIRLDSVTAWGILGVAPL